MNTSSSSSGDGIGGRSNRRTATSSYGSISRRASMIVMVVPEWTSMPGEGSG